MSRRRGLGLTEVLVVLAVLAVVLAAVTVAGRRSSAMRSLDAGARELEAALKYARQAAPNSGGGRVEFTGDVWRVVLGSRVASEGRLPRDLALVLDPASPARIEFSSAGSVAAQRTVTLTSAATGATRQIRVHAMTGAVERVGP